MVSKKFFAKAFAFAMVTGLLTVAAPAMGKVWATGSGTEPQQPAKVQPVKVDVSYEEMSVTIYAGHDKDEDETQDDYVFLEVMKKENDEKQGTVYPFPLNGDDFVTVDLSFLKITKPSYLRVWGDKSGEKVTVTINAQPSKIKYKYAAQAFPELEGKDESAIQAALEKYYADSFGITDKTLSYGIRTLYGTGYGSHLGLQISDDGKWGFSLQKDWLANLKVTGTTLVICQMPKNDSGEGTTLVKGHPAGPEAKVKIPAAPKAPKVTIDYAKGTIKLPKNAEYGIIKDKKIEYVALANGGTLSPKEILENIAKKLELEDKEAVGETPAKPEKTEFINGNLKDGFDLVVRTNDAKKGASNPTFVSVKGTVSYGDNKWGKITLTTKDASDNDVVTEIATYEFSDAGVTVTAKVGSFEYEESGKWKKISSGKLIKGKTSELTIRMAGVKDKDETKASFPSTEMTIKKPEDKSKVVVSATGNKTTITTASTDTTTLNMSSDTDDILNRDGEKVAASKITTYEWKSSDESVATVTGTNGTATVTGKTAGKCTITLTVTFDDNTKAMGTIEITVTSVAPAGGDA